MLQILLSWLITALTAIFLGGLAEKLLKEVFPQRTLPGLWMQFWIGLVFLSLLLSITTFFFPLGSLTKIFLWLTAILLPLFLSRKTVVTTLKIIRQRIYSFHPLSWLPFLLTASIGLIKSAGAPEIFDEGAYHLPLIRMWEQKGLVVGMANLNGHYGLHSVWHLLSAFTNLNFFPGFVSEMSLNGLLAALVGLFASSRLQLILEGRNPGPSAIIAALLPVFLFRNLLSSPSTDVPAILGCWFLFLFWLEVIEKRASMAERVDLFLLLPLLIVMLKSSTAGILLVPAIFTLGHLLAFRYKCFLFSALVFVLVFGLWLLQNWLISGYAVFPHEFTAMGKPFWQVPHESILKKFYLEQFGAFAPPENYSSGWLKSWFAAQNTDSKIIILLSAVFFSLAPFLWLRNKETPNAAISLFLVLLFQAGIWFFTITEPRYGFGALVISALLLPAFFLSNQMLSRPKLRFVALIIFPLMLLNLVKTIRENPEFVRNLIQPALVPHVRFRMLKCGNFSATCPQAYETEVPPGKPVFCWDCPFPCFPLEGTEDSSFVFEKKMAWFTSYYFHKKHKPLNNLPK